MFEKINENDHAVADEVDFRAGQSPLAPDLILALVAQTCMAARWRVGCSAAMERGCGRGFSAFSGIYALANFFNHANLAEFSITHSPVF